MEFSILPKKKKRKNFQALKEKKRENYLKSKLKNSIDYKEEIESGDFFNKLQELTKNHMKYAVLSREEIIEQKIEEYKLKKKLYYEANKESRKKYTKEYKQKS